jgi:hypothetical protein
VGGRSRLRDNVPSSTATTRCQSLVPATEGLCPPRFAGRADQVGPDQPDRLSVRPVAEHGMQRAFGDDGRPTAVLTHAGRGIEPFTAPCTSEA